MTTLEPIATMSHADAWMVLRGMAFMREQYGEDPTTDLDFAADAVPFAGGPVDAMVTFPVSPMRFDMLVPGYSLEWPTWLSWLELLGIELACGGGWVAIHRVPRDDDVESELALVYHQTLRAVVERARHAMEQHGNFEA
jgi:hypothetical protein